ncbi:hypothetical protein [Saccharothrix yanglingensis]|uniref:DUF5648 domain-containing protein n=1 Tax=Saccharothrix yanglingensis TaxID=659496 RepID=A0ABU0XB09_9PSEU|nr:hypothetical protein [Saccharothrix yanglingensis]MDQ2589285.1 hypothetical protein [Saccharothrix yanglingensis]
MTAVLVAVTSVVAVTPVATAEVSTQASLNAAFYRLYNPSTGDNYNTTNRNDALSPPAGYTYSSLDAFVSTSPQAGLIPFYRIYSPQRKDRYHTASWDEVVAATTTQGYIYEGVSAYVYPPNSGSGIPFHRLRHPGNGDHVLMTNPAEVNSAISSGYVYEGVAADVG